MLHNAIIKKAILLILFFSLPVFSCLWTFGMQPQKDNSAQKEVKLLNFEVNQQEILVTKRENGYFQHQEGVLGTKINIIIDVDGYQIEPVYTNEGFLVPDEVYRAKNINVHFLLGDNKFCVPSLTKDNFQASWHIQVVFSPFSYVTRPEYNEQIQENKEIKFLGLTTPEYKDGKKLVAIYFITFDYGKSCAAVGNIVPVYE